LCPQLLRIEHLVKYFPAKAAMFYSESGALAKGSKVHALDGVTFSLEDNSTLGIVGESGCGKSTLARTILMLSRPTAGKVFFEGKDLTELGYGQLSKIRPRMQMVFQDPFSSLDPRMRARDIISEPLKVVMDDRDQIRARVREVFEQVGLNVGHLDRFPNEFSGGQRQRIAIARAISTRPKLVVLDEPTSALDASTQAQILNLLKDIQQEYKISYLFISHNINVVRYMSNRIGVMYLGKVVEIGSTDAVLKETKHPYSRALVDSIPQPDPRKRVKMVEIRGETPSSLTPPPGCRYNPRCPYMTEVCKMAEPQLVEMEQQTHLTACHHPLK
jgi:oligopeptide/dipeptide ABC transporter ATP-binding protein